MRVLIVGAGGIGCYYGARLQALGDEVVYVARGEHLLAMQTQGLIVKHAEFDFHQPVQAVDEQTLLQSYPASQFDLIILCIKAFDTPKWLQRCHAWLSAASTPILSLQNGIDNEALIAALLGQARVWGGLAVRIGGHVVEPGRVSVDGPAQVVFGVWPSAEAINKPSKDLLAWQEHFMSAGIPARISANISAELWRKLLINNGVNPLSAITGLTTRALVDDPHFGPCVRQLMLETLAVAQAEGVPLTMHDVDEMFSLLKSFDAIKTSMLVDHEQGKPIELDEICGALLARADKLDVVLPCNQMLYALLAKKTVT